MIFIEHILFGKPNIFVHASVFSGKLLVLLFIDKIRWQSVLCRFLTKLAIKLLLEADLSSLDGIYLAGYLFLSLLGHYNQILKLGGHKDISN